jgi:hypothetical protein
MSRYSPQVTITYIADKLELVDTDLVSISGRMLGVGGASVDMAGVNRGSTFGMRFQDPGGNSHSVVSVDDNGDGTLLLECAGVAVGWKFIATIGCPSLESKEGFQFAGTIKRVTAA